MVAGIVAIGLAGGTALGLSRTPRPLAAASLADRFAGCSDHLRAALELASRSPADPFVGILIAESERTAGGLSSSKVVPIRFGSNWPVGAAILASAIAGAIWIPVRQPDPTVATRRVDPGAVALASEVARAAGEVRAASESVGPALSPREAERFAELERELLDGSIRSEDARAEAALTAAELAERAAREAEQNRIASERLRELASAASQRAGAPPDPSAPSPGGTREPLDPRLDALMESLASGDLARAADAARELEQRAPSMSSEERARLADQLDALAQSLDDSAPPEAPESSAPAAPSEPDSSSAAPLDEPSAPPPESQDPIEKQQDAEAARERERKSSITERAERDAGRDARSIADAARDAAQDLREPPPPVSPPTEPPPTQPPPTRTPDSPDQPEPRSEGSPSATSKPPEQERSEEPGEPKPQGQAQGQKQGEPKQPGQEQGQAQGEQSGEKQESGEAQGEQEAQGERDTQGQQGAGSKQGEQRDEGEKSGGQPQTREGSGSEQQGGKQSGEQEPKPGDSRPGELKPGERPGASPQDTGSQEPQPQGTDPQGQVTKGQEKEGQEKEGQGPEGQSPRPGGKPDPGTRPNQGSGLERLQRSLREASERSGDSRRQHEAADRLRRLSEELASGADPDARPTGAEPGAGGPRGLPFESDRVTGAPPASIEDVRGPRPTTPTGPGRVAAERPSDRQGPVEVAPITAGSLREAASGVERAIEQQSVPDRRSDLVRRVFQRYRERAESESARPGGAERP